MKRTILMLAAFAFMVCAVFAVSAAIPARGPDTSVAVSLPGSVLQLNSETPRLTHFAAYDSSAAVLNLSKTWIAKSVGAMPLNVFRRPFDTVKTCEGFGEVLLKPKIATSINANRNSQNRFTGLWGDHFARADV